MKLVILFLATLIFIVSEQSFAGHDDLAVSEMTSSTSTFSGTGQGTEYGGGPLYNTGPETNQGAVGSYSTTDDPVDFVKSRAVSRQQDVSVTQETIRNDYALAEPDPENGTISATTQDFDDSVSGATTEENPSIGNVDVNTGIRQFNFEQRNDFKEAMQSRLDVLQSRIRDIKANAKANTPAAQKMASPSEIKRVETRRRAVSKEINRSTRVPSNRWTSFHDQVSKDVAELESSVEKLETAKR